MRVCSIVSRCVNCKDYMDKVLKEELDKLRLENKILKEENEKLKGKIKNGKAKFEN